MSRLIPGTCRCSMKMSPRNCSVKMSPRYGDLHDEQEGSASGGPRKSRVGGEDTNAEGAGALHLTVRQFKRLKARVRTEGVAGLPHRARGRPGRRHLGADLREQVVTLMTT